MSPEPAAAAAAPPSAAAAVTSEAAVIDKQSLETLVQEAVKKERGLFENERGF